jgi:pSer/pThr/pTyr-binding forkhead associated (FHA) protein
MKAVLRVLSGSGAGEMFALTGRQFLIGRERDCHLRPDNDLVSRHHCVLRLDEYVLRVRDLGSRNGTFVNGQRIKGDVVLRDGDKLYIGDLALEVKVNYDDSTATTKMSSDETRNIKAQNTEIFSGKTSIAPQPYPPPSAIPADAEQKTK